MAFLDLSGLQRFKTKLESLFVKGPASATANHVATFDGTTGKTVKDSGYTIAASVPSGAVFTDTKVTSSANHYTPATASGSDKTASASGATAAWSIDVVKGVTLNTDGKGHVTGLSVTSGKIPANPNTDTKNTAGSTDTSSKIFLIGATSQAANPQTYSHDTAYVGTDGCLYSGGTKVLTAHQDISGKINVNQGAANVGKVLTVGSNGNVTPEEPQSSAPIALSLILAAGSWTSATPPTQTISATGVTASNNIVVGIGSGATAEQYEAAAKAQILCTAQGANMITLTCYGEEPQENVPVSILVVG